MDEVKQLIEQAYAHLLVIPVSGDAVEAMANAKALLRKAFQVMEENNG